MLLGAVALLVASVIVVSAVANLDISGVTGRIHGQVADTADNVSGKPHATQPGDVQGADVRSEESSKMLSYWAESPVWGARQWAVVPGYTRSDTSPWFYEASYHMLWWTSDLLGGAVLGLWALWTGWWLLRGVRSKDRPVVWPCSAAAAGALLASITDPYLFKIDGMWMVFLPFGLSRRDPGTSLGRQP